MNAADAEIRLPAETAYVAVLRMTTAGLAARLDFTLDDIEDLRMAVGEACGLVLEGATESGEMTVGYRLGEARMRVTVSADAVEGGEPDRDSFGWQVLTALVSDLDTTSSSGRRSISFTVTSTSTSQTA